MKHIVLSNTRGIFTYIVGLNSQRSQHASWKASRKAWLGRPVRPAKDPGRPDGSACLHYTYCIPPHL